MRVLVTGGAGFIGSALVRSLVAEGNVVLNVDKLTYAGNPLSLASVDQSPHYFFEKLDVCDASRLSDVIRRFRPEGIYHLAAESHVDRSIEGPAAFVQTNVVGTFCVLEQTRLYWESLPDSEKQAFRFVHVSTDEVYGTLGPTGYFTEDTAYQPNSPYSASKAGSDHLARAWFHTFGLPVITTNCTNNYGPYQFPEKLIPLCLLKALDGKSLPIYGKGENVRDWLFVEDHVLGLQAAFHKGSPGETYNLGGETERTNLAVIQTLCSILDDWFPQRSPHAELIVFVTDRPGHDLRYAMDISKAKRELGWTPRETFESGLRKTVEWYLRHSDWIDSCRHRYQGERLGKSVNYREEARP